MSKQYMYYFLAGLILLVFAGAVFIVNRSKLENTDDNTVEVKPTLLNQQEPSLQEGSTPEVNGISDVQGSTSFDSNMLPEDPPESASKYVISSANVSYMVDKKFLQKPTAKVTGTNSNIKGLGWFDDVSKSGVLYAEMQFSEFATDSPQRDKDILKLFTTTDIMLISKLDNLALDMSGSAKISVPLDMKINGITKPVTFNVDVTITPDQLKAKGSGNIKMSDFGVNPPSLVSVYTVGDETVLNFDITADKAQ